MVDSASASMHCANVVRSPATPTGVEADPQSPRLIRAIVCFSTRPIAAMDVRSQFRLIIERIERRTVTDQ